MWQMHVVQHPYVAFGVDAHTLFDESRRENDAVHHRGTHHGAWVVLPMLLSCTHRDRDLPFVQASRGLQPPKSDCSGSVRCESSGRTSRRRTPRASGALPRIESTPTLQHVTGKVQPCKAVFSCQSWRTDGLEARAWRCSCSARHSVERDMSSELCRRSTLRVCHGFSVAAVSTSARTSLVRRRFSGRDWSGAPRRSCLIFVLMLSSDQSGRNAWFSAVHEPLAKLGNVLHCPRPMTRELQTRERSSEEIKNCLSNHQHPSSSIIARDATRRVHLTTSQQWPE